MWHCASYSKAAADIRSLPVPYLTRCMVLISRGAWFTPYQWLAIVPMAPYTQAIAAHSTPRVRPQTVASECGCFGRCWVRPYMDLWLLHGQVRTVWCNHTWLLAQLRSQYVDLHSQSCISSLFLANHALVDSVTVVNYRWPWEAPTVTRSTTTLFCLSINHACGAQAPFLFSLILRLISTELSESRWKSVWYRTMESIRTQATAKMSL